MVSVGTKLREKRKEKGLSIDEVSKATKIKAGFLQAIEKGEYQKLPSSAYAFGFVSNYVEYLGLPKKETMAMFRRESAGEKVSKVLPSGMEKRSLFQGIRVSQTVFVVVVLFFLLLGYFLFQYRYAIIEPPLTVTSPAEGAAVDRDNLVVEGHTDPSVLIFVNDQPTPVDDNGAFEQAITLSEGEEIIEVRAEHKLGKQTQKILRVTAL